MTPSQRSSSRWSMTALLLILACGPKIQEFKVEPRRVCPGDTVRVTFKTRGAPHLLTVRHGSTLADTTAYIVLAVSRGDTAKRVMDVVTFMAGATPPLAFESEMLGADSLLGRDSLRAETWPDVLKVGEVFSDSGRKLLVRHGGKEGVVGAEGSNGWAGLPVNGAWEVHSGLNSGEVPGDPAHHPPAHLYLRISLQCEASGAQP